MVQLNAVSFPRAPFWLLKYFRNELPGWGKLAQLSGLLVPIDSRRWVDAPTVIMRGKLHGYQMKLDLSDWAQRMTYFLGRYYELHLARLLDAALLPGDRFVDIGSNIGMLALHAARLVTKTGRVDCFEPNPDCLNILHWHRDENQLTQVFIHPVGLSDASGRSTLHLTSEHSGTATMARADDLNIKPLRSIDVAIETGDEILLDDDREIKLIKIDVEGFEYKVLKGLRETLATSKPLVVTELIDAYLARCGSSVREIYVYMTGLDYKPYSISLMRRLGRFDIELEPLGFTSLSSTLAAGTFGGDVLWIHRASPSLRSLTGRFAPSA